MRVHIKDITGAINKIAEITAGDKNIPGILFNVKDNELEVCYSDGHKSLIEKIDATTTDDDRKGKIVVNYDLMRQAINQCQPSGSIVVGDIEINIEDKVLNITAEQKYEVIGEEGEEPEYRNMAVKKLEVAWIDASDKNLKAAILNRMEYDKIFEADRVDTWENSELIDILNKTSTEKGKVIYMSPKIQKVFVSNIAHVCSVPVSSLDISAEEMSSIEYQLKQAGKSDDEIEEFKETAKKRMTFPAAITTQVAQSLKGVLSRIGSEELIYLHVDGNYVNLFTQDNKVGIWVEMAQASKMHTAAFERFSNAEYKTYQLTFAREFLVDNIKSVMSSTNNEKVTFEFKDSELEENEIDLVINASNRSASVSAIYSLMADETLEAIDDSIKTRKLNVSIKVFNEMLSQLKTGMVAMDIHEAPDGSIWVRLAELNMEKAEIEYFKARKELDDDTPTPKESKMDYRVKTLDTCQYTMLGK